ncbi:MAG: hypothetical protein DRO88_02745 [Promethearchaeia archaeon]|nr:MAG: hypothetical protein DRO88_02745 [Candidatus Lokiarchaeia archaeon]
MERLKQLGRFGFASISRETFNWILAHFPDGNVMLELGSGNATKEFTKHYSVYSIEHNPEWVGKAPSNYIYAPIINYGEYSWYDTKKIQKKIPKHYDFILIDGPPKKIGREGFLHNLELFNTQVPLIFDDANRGGELVLIQKIAGKLKFPYHIIKTGMRKKIGIIAPPSWKI